LLQATINGRGVALARDDLAVSHLVWPFPEIDRRSELAY
jgi:hypothetical protein